MKISLNWLRELVEGDLDGKVIAERLTMAGLEVESRVPFGLFSGVVVAEVKGKRPHPDASKLTLVDVAVDGGVTQVVCGASNVPEPGLLVAWARPGSRLPKKDGGLFEIGPKTVRGIVSPGMLCAEDELGLGTSHDGILVFNEPDGLHAGDDLATKWGLPDEILEVNVTPNRPDCLGHLGIAREVAALTGTSLRKFERHLPMAGKGPVSVEIRDEAGCPRYLALVLEEATMRPSPMRTRLRLEAMGMRAISGLVDATNLAMLETGQPLHAFDLDRVAGGGIVVRRASAGETLRTLDGELRSLEPGDLLICDATSRPIALAGIMGGAETEVSASTRRLLLECAYFDPTSIRRTAKRLGLHSEASHRFERGTDPNGLSAVAARCAELLSELGGARVTGPAVDVYPRAVAPRKVTLRPRRTVQLLGFEIREDEQARLLSSIGLLTHKRDGLIEVSVPTFRPDLSREVDLIEEIARLYGYHHIPATLPQLSVVHSPTRNLRADAARDVLSALGLTEHIGYAFVSPAGLALFSHGFHGTATEPLRLQNPLREEQSAMRTTLVHGLLSAVGRNLARGEQSVRLFEIGRVFWPKEGEILPAERLTVAGVLSGPRDGWLKESEAVDFFDLKGLVEELLTALGRESSTARSNLPFLHPGLQAEVRSGEARIGWLGEVHPETRRRLGIEVPVLAFELDLDELGPPKAVMAAELPRFPAITRDLSFFIDEQIAATTIGREMESLLDPLCREIQVLEDYREPGRVPAGKKGMLWSFVYRATDRTLTVEEVKSLHEGFVNRLKASLSLDLR